MTAFLFSFPARHQVINDAVVKIAGIGHGIQGALPLVPFLRGDTARLAGGVGKRFQQANLVTLRYGLGWRVKVIAAHLGLAENTASADLRRALVRLQSRLAPQETPARRTE